MRDYEGVQVVIINRPIEGYPDCIGIRVRETHPLDTPVRRFMDVVTPVAHAAGVTQDELQAVGEWLASSEQNGATEHAKWLADAQKISVNPSETVEVRR